MKPFMSIQPLTGKSYEFFKIQLKCHLISNTLHIYTFSGNYFIIFIPKRLHTNLMSIITDHMYYIINYMSISKSTLLIVLL